MSFKKKAGIGIKLVCGVALASNVFILLLLYSVWHWDKQVNSTSRELLQIQTDLNTNLRESVRNLQDRLVKLPQMLETDTGQWVMNWLKTTRTVTSEKNYAKRHQYKSFFTRAQRRDLGQGEFIIQEASDSVIITKATVDTAGNVTEAIHQVIIASDSPARDIKAIQNRIDTITAQGRTGDAMRGTLEVLKADIAEDLILAEISRTEVLSKLELIDLTQSMLADAKQQRKTVIITIGCLTILANILMIIFLTRHFITNPLKGIVTALNTIAKGEGDLTRVLVVRSSDELGELAFWFNRFVEKLKTIISQIQGQMKNLAQSVKTLSHISNDLGIKAAHMDNKSKDAAASSEQTAGKIERMAEAAQAANQMVMEVAESSAAVSGEMDHLGDAANRVSTAVSAIAAAIEEMYASLQEVAANTGRGTAVTNTATQQANDSTAIIRDLRLSAREINEVVELIQGIADQTHLLSFNAAIEAAGAGEAGKGFTVVAQEVKELSRRTANATRIIGDKIEMMQTSTDVVIKSIVSIVAVINETHDIMSSISSSVEEQTITVNEISKNISQTAHFADTVSETLQNTINLEKDVSRKLGTVSQTAQKIAHDAKDASEQTRQTRRDVMEVNDASLATLEDTQRIEAEINKLTAMYQKLHQIVIQFKL